MFPIYIKMKRACFFISIIFFFIVSYGYASVSVELTLDRSSVVVTDTVVLKVKVSGTKKTSLPEFYGLDAFDVVKGGTSARLEIINGETRSGIDYTFYLHPMKQGAFDIGPALVKMDGKIYTSNKVHLVVKKNVRQSGKQKEALFIEASVSHDSLFVNQQVVYLVKFFRARQVSDVSLDMPEIEEITFESLGEPNEYSEIIGSKRYEIIELRYVMSAKKAGEYRIFPLKMRMTVYERSRQDSFFQDPFFSMRTGRSVYLVSNEIVIRVKNLPVENRPSDYTGLVGKFTMTSSGASEIIKANDSLTLTVQVSGTGNIRQIPDLKISDIDDVKIYQDKPVLDIKKSATAIIGTKIMKWAIVPEKGGVFTVPSFFLSYFDPVKESYIGLKTGPITIKALSDPVKDMNHVSAVPVKNSELADSYNENKKKVITRIGKDIFPIHSSKDPLKAIYDHNYMQWLFIFFIVLPPAAFFGIIIVMTLKKRKVVNSDVSKSRNACGACINKLAHEHLTPQYIYGAIVEYLNNRFLLKGGVVTPDEAAEILLARGVPEDIAGRLQENMQQMEAVIFAGTGKENLDSNIQNKLVNTVKSIEKEVK